MEEIKITKNKKYLEMEQLINESEKDGWVNCLILTQFPKRESMLQGDF